MQATPLSVELSRLLVAFTVELDNAFEERLPTVVRGERYRITSLVMWSNLVRFVGAGCAVGELPVAAGLPKRRVLSMVGGLERWRYVSVASPRIAESPRDKRDGYGSARELEADWVVRPTAVGAAAQRLWPTLLAEVEDRWSSRFGTQETRELRDACAELADPALPEYLPIVVGSTGMASEVTGPCRPSDPIPLSGLIARVLLAYTLEFEQAAPLSLPLTETVVHVIGESGIDVRELPVASAVSPEAIAMSLRFLSKRGYVAGAKHVRLTTAGREAADASRAAHGVVEQAWKEHDSAGLDRVRRAARAILDQRDGDGCRLARGLEPHSAGWRASAAYKARTDAMLADPLTGLPRHPLVLPRGGWPDGG